MLQTGSTPSTALAWLRTIHGSRHYNVPDITWFQVQTGKKIPGHSLSDGGLHQPGQGGEHVDWGVDLGRIGYTSLHTACYSSSKSTNQSKYQTLNLSVVELPVHVDLSLGDVAGQVGDGVGDVVVGHRQYRDLGGVVREFLDCRVSSVSAVQCSAVQCRQYQCSVSI